MIRPLPIVLLAAFVFPLPARAAVPDAAEVAAFREVNERYADRMLEFNADTRAFVERTYQEERQKITQTYGAARTRLEDQEATTRRVAIAKIEAFLQKYPVAPPVADMKFRLADLYYEEAETDWFDRSAEYARLEQESEGNAAATLPEPPAKDYRRSVALYQDIIANHPTYENLPDTHYMLGWCLSSTNAAQFDEDAARDVYLAIISKYPQSPFANDANMRVGEYYFDQPTSREDPGANVRTAIKYYEAVLADGPEGRNFDHSIYKLGWSHYKLNEYDRSLAFLVQLLDYSDDQFLKSGKPSNTRPEAVQYLAITYSDTADRQGRKPVEVAMTHLKKVGDRKWQHDVIEYLAQILRTQAKFDASIETYRFLQDNWPLDPKNPDYQFEIGNIYRTQPIPDEAARGKALADLAERYTEGTPWFKANLTNPDAIAKARGYIQGSLATVATEILIHAKETGEVDDFRLAAAKYKDFLEKFPFADDYDEYEWYYAYSLFSSNQFKDAEREYLQILKNERTPYRDQARFQLMKSREQLVLAAYGKMEAIPDGAIIERIDTSASGQQIQRYMLSDEHKAYLASCDDLSSREFSDPDMIAVLEHDRKALTYIPAFILYNYGHYDEALPRLEKVRALYKGSPEASFAAGLIVAIYQNQGDLAKVAEVTRKILDAGGLTDEQKAKLGGIEEQTAYNLIQALIDRKDHLGAAAAFLDFIQRFPRSKIQKEALYSAANQYELGGRSDESIRLFEQYITKYPTDDRSKYLYFRIAQNYSSILDLAKAVEYYEQLPKLFPDFEDSKAAMFNAAFLRVGIGDHRGAALEFEKYAMTYPTDAGAEAAFWRAGEQWLLVSETDAVEFYGRYLKRFPTSEPNHLIEAQYRLAKYWQKRGDARKSAAQWSQLQSSFAANAAGALTQQARSMAAEGALNDVLAQFESFKKYKFSTSEKANVELVIKQKPEELKSLAESAVRLIQTYQDYDTAAASLYIQGMAYFAYADIVYNVPPPGGLTEEETEIYQQQLDSFRLPAEDRGKTRLTAALEKARAEKRWNDWNSKTVTALHDRYPLEFPSERAESRGSFSPVAIPISGPESISAPAGGGN